MDKDKSRAVAIKTLKDRYEQQYSTLSDFADRSGCPISRETVRVALYENRPISAPVFMLISKYLDFSPNEIRTMLKQYGDKEYWPLIGESKDSQSPADRALAEAIAAIREKDPSAINTIADHLELVGRAVGADVSKHAAKLRTTRRTNHPRRK